MEPIKTSVVKIFWHLWEHLSQRRKLQFGALLILMSVTSLMEIINIGAVIPFLSTLLNPDYVSESKFINNLLEIFSINSEIGRIQFFAIIFCIITLVTNGMRFLVLWLNVRLSLISGGDLSYLAFRNTLYQPYAIHISRNSGDVIHGVLAKVGDAASTINAVLTLITSIVLLVVIVAAIFFISPKIALFSFFGFSIIYIVVILLTKKKLIESSGTHIKQSGLVMKALIEGLAGIRDVLIDGSQDFYARIFSKSDLRSRRARGNIQIIGSSPRYMVETLGVFVIVGISYFVALENGNFGETLPFMGAFALGAQRLVPVLHNAYVSWSNIQGSKAALVEALALLDQSLPAHVLAGVATQLSFENRIKLNSISFQYSPSSPVVLKNISLQIERGSIVGFIGKTGCGKSTLIDIVMGLLIPSAGWIDIDGVKIDENNRRGWQLNIAHVPQNIFLCDGSIEENIAFGLPIHQIDIDRVKFAAEAAQISNEIESLDFGYKTRIGERGIWLSGGQRQRIGIARALYKKASVIILDEATSALDSETEEKVIHAISNMHSYDNHKPTILMIAHRLTTLKCCSKIYKLGNGLIIGEYSFDQLFQ